MKWIDPWVRHLEEDLGAVLHRNMALTRLGTSGAGELTEVTVRELEKRAELTLDGFDFVVLALPLGKLQGLVGRVLAEEDALRNGHGNPSLMQAVRYPLETSTATRPGQALVMGDVPAVRYPLETSTATLSGMQFHLRDDASILPGHVFLPDSGEHSPLQALEPPRSTGSFRWATRADSPQMGLSYTASI